MPIKSLAICNACGAEHRYGRYGGQIPGGGWLSVFQGREEEWADDEDLSPVFCSTACLAAWAQARVQDGG